MRESHYAGITLMNLADAAAPYDSQCEKRFGSRH